jgi:soluble lytic murein transglycosylase-like protein
MARRSLFLVVMAGAVAYAGWWIMNKKTLVDIIKLAASKYDLDWKLALSVAWTESRLNPNAIGDDGNSFGLFQVQKRTADWLEKKDISTKDLLIPELSADIGCHYLSYQLERYHGNKRIAVEAYNAGHNYTPDINSGYINAVMNLYEALSELLS